MSEMNLASMGFSIINNVEIQVVNKDSRKIIKTVKTHNKATRNMVTGILRFVQGVFTKTDLKPDKPMYDDDIAKRFIPCYFNVGDGGVILDDNGFPKTKDGYERIPDLDSNWNETVPYMSTNLIREFTMSGARTKIRKELDTLDNDSVPSGDMDSLYFSCELSPGTPNKDYSNHAVYVTELGLFSGSIPNSDDLLAYVKLGNYVEDDVQKTNALYVRPGDTIIVKWIITIAAIGRDNILHAEMKDENGDKIVNDAVVIPRIAPIEIIEYKNS